MTPRHVHRSDILAAKLFYEAERLGGLFYQRFAAGLDHPDVAHAIRDMAGDESTHARWYAEWLRQHGESPPQLAGFERLLVPGLKALLAPQSLDRQLRSFAKGEATAVSHLDSLAERVRDPELKAIVLRTLPFEQKHAEWYRREGRKMLRPRDYRRA